MGIVRTSLKMGISEKVKKRDDKILVIKIWCRVLSVTIGSSDNITTNGVNSI